MDPQDENDNKNRGGRPVGLRGVRVLASRHSHDCIRALACIAKSEQTPAAARVAAADVILRYATSRPATSETSGASNGA